MDKLHDMTATQWKTADAIAMHLADPSKFDNNELKKTIAYLRTYQHVENAGANFFSYLETLSKEGEKIGHSPRAQLYYKNLLYICEQALKENYIKKPQAMLLILSWASRLVQYYLNSPPVDKIDFKDISSEREHTLQKIYESFKPEIGQVIDAVVAARKGKKVTYVFLGGDRKSSNEDQYFEELDIGQEVKVIITKIKEDGSVKKVKYHPESNR